MPIYDRRCPVCALVHLDRLEPVNNPDVVPCETCGAPTERVWIGKGAAIIGDEIDVTIKHGLCNPDGTPRRYESRAELNREAKARGWVNHVEHKPGRGTDKSPHTSRWV